MSNDKITDVDWAAINCVIISRKLAIQGEYEDAKHLRNSARIIRRLEAELKEAKMQRSQNDQG